MIKPQWEWDSVRKCFVCGKMKIYPPEGFQASYDGQWLDRIFMSFKEAEDYLVDEWRDGNGNCE